jgi:hypothetical protein
LKRKKEDEISAHPAISPSTIPLTSGIEEAPQLLLSVLIFLPHLAIFRKRPLEALSSGHLRAGEKSSPKTRMLECVADLC